MAKKRKIDHAFLEQIEQRETRETRKTDIREKRQYFLIVCEGKKTEPNYFEELSRKLPNGLVTLDIIGAGDNTLNLVNIAVKKRAAVIEEAQKCHRSYVYDQVWVVFDKDDFPDERFNNAIFKAEENNINYAYSIEAFELWFLLHFQYYDTALSRKQYKKLLSDHLGFKYQKNADNMYGILMKKGNQTQAIQWANKLYKSYNNHINPAQNNPSTTVYKLVEELIKFMDKNDEK